MRQRVISPLPWPANPRLIIADEPTTALDVTIQAQILDGSSKELNNKKSGTAVIIITTTWAMVAEMADFTVVP